MSNFNPTQLGQLRPLDTAAASIYSPASGRTWEANSITVCNSSGAAATFRIFHDEDGAVYDKDSSLFWDIAIAADTTVTITSFMAGVDPNGNVGVQSSIGGALNFTLYGPETL